MKSANVINLNAQTEAFCSCMKDKTQSLKKLMTYYSCAIMEVETKFNVLNEEFSLQHDRTPITDVKSRLKSFESIVNKLTKKGK